MTKEFEVCLRNPFLYTSNSRLKARILVSIQAPTLGVVDEGGGLEL